MRQPTALVAAGLAFTFALTGCGSSPADGPATGATASSTTTAQGSLPKGFFGVVAPELYPATDADLNQALDAQAKAGVGLLRQSFLWQYVEPEPGTFDYAKYDRLVGAAAQRGIAILPIIFGVSPGEGAKAKPGAKVTDTTTMPPLHDAHFAAYAVRLVQRYGPDGAFWKDHPKIPKLPITSWQVWNEPNLKAYWGGTPDATAYGKLLKTTAKAIRGADPKAQIVTAGLPNSKLGGSLSTYVRTMIKRAGTGSFDVLAVHPYAQSAADVLASAKQTEQVAEAAGAGDIGLWITEVGWATDAPSSPFTVGETQQAQLVGDLLRQSADQATALRLRGVVYYAWRDAPVYEGGTDFWGLHTGLVKRDNAVKPSLTTFADTIKAIRSGG
ncbi:MAG: hypothetical protein AAGC46_13125 [Solirubrobacteraceae bacterium]